MTSETPWAPLSHSVFRALWIATFASNMGSLMQTVGAAWLMTSLAPSPLLVALVQTANTLPIFLLAMLAGALADILDRRKLLLATQGWMCGASILLAILTLNGWTTPWLLLGLTFALGLGAALNAPAWQAIVSELVPRSELPSAVALNSMGLNLARAVAPAIGGLVVASAGPGAAFLLNSASFVGVLVVLFKWKRPPRKSGLPSEHLADALRTGIRYVRYSPNVQAVLFRTGGFMLFGSSIWALLPLLSRFELGLGPTGYGLLMGSLGLGAVAGAILLPRLRQAFDLDRLLAVATLGYALGTLVPAFFANVAPVCVAMAVAGFAWLVQLSSFNATVQSSVPTWVRGRAMASYLLVAFGAQALGAALWGSFAGWVGLPATFGICGVGLLASLGLHRRFRLTPAAHVNLDVPGDPPSQALSWASEPGRVRVTLEYRIEGDAEPEFRSVMGELRLVRLRNGALSWELLGDRLQVGRFVETFEAASGTELLRLYDRMTVTDQEIERQVLAFHREATRPLMAIARSDRQEARAVDHLRS